MKSIFFIVIIAIGLLGAASDIYLSLWAEKMTFLRWCISATFFLCFMTCLGVLIRLGTERGYSLTLVVLVVLLANIAGVAIWDILRGGKFTAPQLLGVALAILSIICFEYK